MPAWTKAEGAESEVEKLTPDTFQSNEEPRCGTEPLRIGLIEDRFEYLSGRTLIKDEKIVQRYHFLPMKTTASQSLTGLGRDRERGARATCSYAGMANGRRLHQRWQTISQSTRLS
jgi:hypothetical protein